MELHKQLVEVFVGIITIKQHQLKCHIYIFFDTAIPDLASFCLLKDMLMAALLIIPSLCNGSQVLQCVNLPLIGSKQG